MGKKKLVKFDPEIAQYQVQGRIYILTGLGDVTHSYITESLGKYLGIEEKLEPISQGTHLDPSCIGWGEYSIGKIDVHIFDKHGKYYQVKINLYSDIPEGKSLQGFNELLIAQLTGQIN